jgi:hypothetical protein
MVASGVGGGGAGEGAGLSPDLLHAIKITDDSKKEIIPFFIL